MTIEALLAAHSEQDQQNFEEIKQDLREARELREELKTELKNEIQKISTEISKYKGFVGGVIFVVSAIFTALGLAIAWVSK